MHEMGVPQLHVLLLQDLELHVQTLKLLLEHTIHHIGQHSGYRMQCDNHLDTRYLSTVWIQGICQPSGYRVSVNRLDTGYLSTVWIQGICLSSTTTAAAAAAATAAQSLYIMESSAGHKTLPQRGLRCTWTSFSMLLLQSPSSHNLSLIHVFSRDSWVTRVVADFGAATYLEPRLIVV